MDTHSSIAHQAARYPRTRHQHAVNGIPAPEARLIVVPAIGSVNFFLHPPQVCPDEIRRELEQMSQPGQAPVHS